MKKGKFIAIFVFGIIIAIAGASQLHPREKEIRLREQITSTLQKEIQTAISGDPNFRIQLLLLQIFPKNSKEIKEKLKKVWSSTVKKVVDNILTDDVKKWNYLPLSYPNFREDQLEQFLKSTSVCWGKISDKGKPKGTSPLAAIDDTAIEMLHSRKERADAGDKATSPPSDSPAAGGTNREKNKNSAENPPLQRGDSKVGIGSKELSPASRPSTLKRPAQDLPSQPKWQNFPERRMLQTIKSLSETELNRKFPCLVKMAELFKIQVTKGILPYLLVRYVEAAAGEYVKKVASEEFDSALAFEIMREARNSKSPKEWFERVELLLNRAAANLAKRLGLKSEERYYPLNAENLRRELRKIELSSSEELQAFAAIYGLLNAIASEVAEAYSKVVVRKKLKEFNIQLKKPTSQSTAPVAAIVPDNSPISGWPPSTPIFAAGIALALLGLLGWRKAIKVELASQKMSSTTDETTDKTGTEEFGGSEFSEIFETLEGELIKLRGLQGLELCEQIDKIEERFIIPLSERRALFINQMGMEKGADILVTFAYGERMLNRVWSASADGAHREATESLEEALHVFREIREKLK